MAKEQFREWRSHGFIQIKYKDGQSLTQVWQKDQQELLAQIVRIVKEYADQGIKLTARQTYYRLVAAGTLPNAEETYKRICKFLTDCRYAGLIDWDIIEDRGRVPEKPADWNNVESLVKSAVYSYRLPRWEDQPYYVELYTEKQALESVLKPLSQKYHIYFGCNKGYSSASTMYDLAQRIKEQIQDGKRAVVLYTGDHDSSGLDMIRDIRDRIIEFLMKGEEPIYGFEDGDGGITDTDGDLIFQVIPLALNFEQVRKYNPPPNPAKMTDPRAKWYIENFGESSWELDALEPKVLIQIVEDGIRNFLDIGKYTAWIERESQEKQALKEFGTKLARKSEKEARKK